MEHVDAARTVAVQPDGRILVGGLAACETGVARLLPDGTLDSTFGADGWFRMGDSDAACGPA